ncbi:ACP S-malonyltransferase [Prauserella rugosa]|uniref:Malonyl CoA-acyl carrier protein transacylase n=1 Tax=Prauserella rugosa TaxID=43354 RepID=A0A660CFG9_9PSEU|nr:ACP S-malonyltransferase [Prauserella rugosa]KMS90420.1 ACP S-malonyltransferase [Streptomyces regensis]TWH20269.1 [acyl-carrier-protein] S-malonyltransferase [Prauserella rugosa]
MIGFVFPGQGTVRVGMGGWLRKEAAAAPVWTQADETGDDLTRLCSRGPLARLVDTRNAQPAVTACNLAALAVLRDRGVAPDVVAGHSVGELSALCAAGVLELGETLRLVADRSELMAQLPGRGVMSSVLGLPVARVEELAGEASRPGEPLVVGLDNAEDQVVVSGAPEALERFTAAATDARSITALKVSHAFHSPLMAGAVDAWAETVRAAPLRPPRIPVVPNATGEPTTDLRVITDALIDQLVARVQWTRTMTAFSAMSTVDRCVEVGDSKALTGMFRTVGVRCVSMSDPGALRRLIPGGAR